MKKLILFSAFIIIGFNLFAQRRVDADIVIVRDSIIMTNGKITDMNPGTANKDAVNRQQLVDSVAKYAFVQPVDSLALDTNAINAVTNYTMFADTANNTISFATGLGSTAQIARESLIKVYNANGIAIANGDIINTTGVRPNGTLEVTRAIATQRHTALLWATTDIPVGEVGDAVVVYGSIRNVPVTVSVGQVWLSDADSGQVVSVPPSFPSYVYSLGAATIQDGVNGQYEAKLDAIDFNNIIRNSHNGEFSETFKFNITSDGATITGTLQREDAAGDLTMIFSDGFSDLDVFPTPKTIELTAGTDDNEQLQYVYIDKTTKALTVSTAYWPSTEHIPVAVASLQTAGTVDDRGASRNQFTNNHIADLTDLMGKFDHFSKRLRSFASDYEAPGIDITIVGSGTTNVYATTTGGQSWQLHLQPFDAKDVSTDYIKVENDFTSPGVWVNDFTDITTDASGGSLNNNSHSVVVIGINNSGGEIDQLIMNMPTGTYNSSGDAIADDDKKTVYSIPLKYKGVGILLYRLTFSVTGAGTVWTLNDTEDLRGLMPSTAPGGGSTGGGVTTYLGLSDTYSSYSGLGETGIKVNSGESALEATQWTEDASGNVDISGNLGITGLIDMETATSQFKITENAGGTNIVAGYIGNVIEGGINVRSNTIGGGGFLGFINEISGPETRYATIPGGYDNFIDGNTSTTDIDGAASTIGGGAHNRIFSTHAAIAGGSLDSIMVASDYAFIGAGTMNKVTGLFSINVGGSSNKFDGLHAINIGGLSNDGTGDYLFSGGGNGNDLTNNYATNLGGSSNAVSGEYAINLGGSGNIASGQYGSILGGASNRSSGQYSLSGMQNNTASAIASLALGRDNTVDVTALYSVALGIAHTISGERSFTFNHGNTVAGDYSGAFGREISVSGNNSFGMALSDQNSTDISANNVFAILGGNFLLGTTADNGTDILQADGSILAHTYGTNVQTLTETAGAVAWDMSSGSKAKVTIDETSVITITNMPVGAEATIRIVQGDAGDDNVTFVLSGATVEWRGDDTDLTDDSGAVDYISVVNMDGFLGVTLGSGYITQ